MSRLCTTYNWSPTYLSSKTSKESQCPVCVQPTTGHRLTSLRGLRRKSRRAVDITATADYLLIAVFEGLEGKSVSRLCATYYGSLTYQSSKTPKEIQCPVCVQPTSCHRLTCLRRPRRKVVEPSISLPRLVTLVSSKASRESQCPILVYDLKLVTDFAVFEELEGKSSSRRYISLPRRVTSSCLRRPRRKVCVPSL